MPRLLAAVLLTLSLPSLASEEPVRDIVRKSRERGALNLVGLTAELKLVTATAEGKEKAQVLTTSSRRIDGRNHALARFSAPSGVAGVAVLTVEGQDGAGDDVSLYLPKLKRVRKVARSDRGKAFMDTDFAYADIASGGANEDALSRAADEAVDGRPCFVLKGKGDDAGPYGAVTMWVDQQTYVPMKVDYADKAGKPFKQYRTLKLKAFQARTLAAESVMQNLQTGSKTTMTVLKLEEATPGEEAFTERALERG